MIDLQAVFCTGAWSAAVILAAAIVDCQARATGTRNSDIPRGLDAQTWRWLRALRNRLVHEDRSDPALTIDDQWQRRAEWERHARRAVSAAFAVLYPEGGER